MANYRKVFIALHLKHSSTIPEKKYQTHPNIFGSIKIEKEDLNILFQKIKPRKITRAELIDLED